MIIMERITTLKQCINIVIIETSVIPLSEIPNPNKLYCQSSKLYKIAVAAMRLSVLCRPNQSFYSARQSFWLLMFSRC